MKKLTAILLAIMLLLGVSGCAGTTSATQPPAKQATATITPTEPVATTQADATPKQLTEDQSGTAETMLPVMDSIIRALYENDLEQYSTDPSFVWTVIYLLSVNYHQDTEGVEIDTTEGVMRVPAKLVEGMMAACFNGVSDLPQQESSSMVEYDPDSDMYIMPLSDMGYTYTEVKEIAGDTQDDNNLVITVDFLSPDKPDEPLAQYVFTITPNAQNWQYPELIYMYSVMSVE
jgi:uncharacterized protein YceK